MESNNKNSNAKWIAGIIGATVIGGATLLATSDKPKSNFQPASEESEVSCEYSCTGVDRDCSDFSTHEEAQGFFECCGFTESNDPMKLDSVGVGDGVACESLP